MNSSAGVIVWAVVGVESLSLASRLSSQQGRGSGSVTDPSLARVRYFFSSGRGSRGTGATKEINIENYAMARRVNWSVTCN